MARGSEEQKQAAEVGVDFSYKDYMTHPAWAIIDKALANLESNSDIQLQTARRHVIGYLLKAMANDGVLPPPFPPHFSKEERDLASWELVFRIPRTPQAAKRKLQALKK
jgi:hypothetical protein